MVLSHGEMIGWSCWQKESHQLTLRMIFSTDSTVLLVKKQEIIKIWTGTVTDLPGFSLILKGLEVDCNHLFCIKILMSMIWHPSSLQIYVCALIRFLWMKGCSDVLLKPPDNWRRSWEGLYLHTKICKELVRRWRNRGWHWWQSQGELIDLSRVALDLSHIWRLIVKFFHLNDKNQLLFILLHNLRF